MGSLTLRGLYGFLMLIGFSEVRLKKHTMSTSNDMYSGHVDGDVPMMYCNLHPVMSTVMPIIVVIFVISLEVPSTFLNRVLFDLTEYMLANPFKGVILHEKDITKIVTHVLL